MIRKIKVFLKWLEQHGVDHSRVEIRWTREQGALLNSAVYLPGGSCLLKIPSSIVITSDVAKSDKKVGDDLMSIVDQLNPNSSDAIEKDTLMLVFYLLHLRLHPDNAETWGPYMDVIPPHFTAPLYMLATLNERDSETFRNMLAQTAIWPELESNFESLQAFYDQAIGAVNCDQQLLYKLFGGKQISFQQFMCAYTTVETRAFKYTKRDRKHPVIALAPLCDFANHALTGTNMQFIGLNSSLDSSAANSGVVESSNDFFQLAVLPDASVKPGEQLYLSYNQFDSHQLFQYYGFVIPNNPLDMLCLSLDDEELSTLPSNESDEQSLLESQVKKSLLMQVAGSDDDSNLRYKHSLSTAKGGLDSVLASIRLLVASASELDGVTVANLSSAFEKPLSSKNEGLTCNALLEMLKCNLEYFTGGDLVALREYSVSSSEYDPIFNQFAELAFDQLRLYLHELKRLNDELISKVESLVPTGVPPALLCRDSS